MLLSSFSFYHTCGRMDVIQTSDLIFGRLAVPVGFGHVIKHTLVVFFHITLYSHMAKTAADNNQTNKKETHTVRKLFKPLLIL